MRVLILGATGMAGHTIAIYFQEQGHEVVAFTRKKIPGFKCIVGDAMNDVVLKNALLADEYDAVINCVGLLNQFAEDNKASAVYLNSYLPYHIVAVLNNQSTKYIHMSTDCVFSGKVGNYSENSFRDGESFYDRTKALGEIDDCKNLTFRNSIIGPDCDIDGIGLFNWFMKQHGEINGYTKAIWTGVTTLTLAKAMEKAIQENLSGIYHLVNNQTISKYELLCLFNKYFRDNKLIVHPTETINLNKSLINARNDFSFVVPDYELMIKEMRDWVYGHRKLYPHYFK